MRDRRRTTGTVHVLQRLVILSLLLVPIQLAGDGPAGLRGLAPGAAAQAESGLPKCRPQKSFELGNSPDTIIVRAVKPTILPQPPIAIDDLSAVVSVPTNGVLDVTMKLEAKHRGDGFSDVVGIGAYMSYQYAKTRDALDAAPVIAPLGWVGGTNIRDLRDHYGQINIVGALAVKPGFYRFCVFASAHSALTPSNSIAEVLVEGGGSPLNALRLSYKPGGRLLD